MKKNILLLLFIIFYAEGNAQNDSLMIDLWGANLVCHKQTADDIFDGDGRGDESFVQYFFGIVNMNDGTWRQRLVTANLDIKLLFDGTTYPLNKPIFSQFAIKNDEIIIVVPIAWEQDRGGPDVITAFNNTMNSCLDMIGMQIIQRYSSIRDKYVQGNGYYPGLVSDVFDLRNINWRSFTGLPSFKNLLAPVRDGAGNRPVGMDSNGDFTPAIFTFSRIQLKSMGSPLDAREVERTNFSFNTDYNETALGNTANHGNYSIILGLQKKYISSSNPIQSGISPKQVPTNIKPVTINLGTAANVNVAVATFVITGMWQGQWTADNNTLNFKLDDAGFLELYNINNAVAARGTYTFSGDQLNAKFTLNGRNYALTGLCNRANGTLSGTWKQTNSLTLANGTWNLTKK